MLDQRFDLLLKSIKREPQVGLPCAIGSERGARPHPRERQQLPFVLLDLPPQQFPLGERLVLFGRVHTHLGLPIRLDASQLRAFRCDDRILAMSRDQGQADANLEGNHVGKVGATFGVGQFRAPVGTPVRLRKLDVEPRRGGTRIEGQKGAMFVHGGQQRRRGDR